MSDFLLELRSEEIPARMQAKARADLARLFAEQLAAAGLSIQAIETYTTPRRLALIARGLPSATDAVSEERKGPRADAPEQAIAGFLKSTGLARDQLVERDLKGQATLFAVIEKPGRATAQVLAEAIPAIVRAFPWPKSMRWGDASASTESPRWVRPLQGIVALFGEDILECDIAGITSGAATLGHRFHHPGPITIGGAHDYIEKLRACHVIVDHEERANIIREACKTLAADDKLEWVEDEALVTENAGLTEWPVPLLGRFDPAFLELPPEVIRLTLATNQKHFVCRDRDGELAPAFICTANIAATDNGAAIIAGNRKVLAARLSDARFFWDQDRKLALSGHAEKLDRITFHEKLGTVADKVDRVAKLARWLVEEGIVPGADPDLAEQVARLCKADLVTEMVGEFPELQGIIGGYYARAEGLDPQFADAIRDHYKPVGQGDEVPTAPVTVAVSLADKLDTIVGFFRVGESPTGSRDPFALRRATFACIEYETRGLARFELTRVIEKLITLYRPQAYAKAVEANSILATLPIEKPITTFSVHTKRIDNEVKTYLVFGGQEFGPFEHDVFQPLLIQLGVWGAVRDDLTDQTIAFFADRLKVQQRGAGVRHDLIDAVFALGKEDDLIRLLARVRALQAFVETADGTNLLAGYKRAANILKKEGYFPSPRSRGEGWGEGPVTQLGNTAPLPTLSPEGTRAKKSLSYTPELAETALIAALDSAEPRAAQAIEAEDFAAAMAALASLRQPIDRFFEEVTVNDSDEKKRAARLDLLARIRAATHAVADFSKIEG